MSIFSQVAGSASSDVNTGVTGDVADAIAANDGLVLLGYSCRESDASPAVATFRLLSGSDAIIYEELAANASNVEWFGPNGIAVPGGITIDHITGTFDVTIFYRAII